MSLCRECRFFYIDNRVIKYRRQPMFFCDRKSVFHSRNFRIGEGSRIAENAEACPLFQPQEETSSPAALIYVEKDN